MRARAVRFSVFFAAFLSLLAGITLALLYYFPVFISLKLDTTSARRWPGYAYAAAVPDYFHTRFMETLFPVESDSPESPKASQLQLFENSTPLGPPHSMHADIEDKGQGRFSDWDGYVVFSAADNSSPIDNGRTYSVRYPLLPAWWLPLVLLACAIAGAAFLSAASKALKEPASKLDRIARDASRVVWALFRDSNSRYLFWGTAALMSLYMNVAFSSLLPAPSIAPDSAGYLLWSPFRPSGYPGFLALYHLFFSTWTYLPIVQLNVLILAILCLAYAIARLSRSYLAGWLFLILISAAGTMMLLSAADMLTEAVFASVVMFHLAFAYLFLSEGKAFTALLAGLSLAGAILIKSVGTVFLGPAILLLVFLPARRKMLFALIFCPAVAAWIGPSTYNYVQTGVFDSSIEGGFALGGYVAWGIHPHAGSAYSTEAQLIERRLAPILAKRPAHFKNIGEYLDYTANEYNTLLWVNMVPELKNYYGNICALEVSGLLNRPCLLQVNKTLFHLAGEAIASDPWRYSYQVLANYYGMWPYVFASGDSLLTGISEVASSQSRFYLDKIVYKPGLYGPMPTFQTTPEREAAVADIGDSMAKKSYDLSTLRGVLPVDRLVMLINQNPWLLLGLSLIASLLIFVARWLPPAGLAFCYTGLILNSYFLGTALAQPALLRYAVPMQGPVLALLLLSAVLAIVAARNAVAANKARLVQGFATIFHPGGDRNGA